MKIELRKEQGETIDFVYAIYVDGMIKDLSTSEEKALQKYNEMKKRLTNKFEPEIIKSEDI